MNLCCKDFCKIEKNKKKCHSQKKEGLLRPLFEVENFLCNFQKGYDIVILYKILRHW